LRTEDVRTSYVKRRVWRINRDASQMYDCVLGAKRADEAFEIEDVPFDPIDAAQVVGPSDVERSNRDPGFGQFSRHILPDAAGAASDANFHWPTLA
jgi:hypothetical protein